MRILALLSLLLSSAPAVAKWVKISESDSVTQYLDTATMKVDGHRRRVWKLQDLKQHGHGGMKSIRILEEYDCKEKRDRILSFFVHSERMARGQITMSNKGSGEWQYIGPETPSVTELKVVCAIH